MGHSPAKLGGGTAGEPLRTVARGILADARRAIEDEARPDPAAVHEFRRAMKRWRALLRLLEPFLGESGRRQRIEARDLARSLSGPRDAQSALNALEDLLKHDSSFSQTSLRTLRNRLENARAEAERAALTDELRERILSYLTRAARAADRWPVARIGFAEIAGRVAQTYRRARRMRPDEWKETNAEELHELRRRVIEHRYQMELVEPLWPRLGKLWVEEAQRLRDRLGRYQDLAELRSMTGPNRVLSHWRSKLSPLIEERQAVHLLAAERLSGRLFAEKPRAFQQRLRAIWKATPSKGSS